MRKHLLIGYQANGLANPEPFLLNDDILATGAHIVGAPGTGKSRWLQAVAQQFIRGDGGVCFLDPHGAVFHELLAYATRYAIGRPLYAIDVSRGERIIGFNPFQPRDGDPSTRAARCVTAILKAWGVLDPHDTPRLARWLKNTFVLAIERGLSLTDLELLFDYRAKTLRAFLAAGTSVEAEWLQLIRCASRSSKNRSKARATVSISSTVPP